MGQERRRRRFVGFYNGYAMQKQTLGREIESEIRRRKQRIEFTNVRDVEQQQLIVARKWKMKNYKHYFQFHSSLLPTKHFCYIVNSQRKSSGPDQICYCVPDMCTAVCVISSANTNHY